MKHINLKNIIITCGICLLPVLFGLMAWDKLPDTLAIHFNFKGEPDNFSPKWFVVFMFPVIIAAAQVFCCIVTDINSGRYGENIRFERVMRWILPFVSVVLQIVTLAYGLGFDVDIRKAAVTIIGIIFLAIGSVLPTLDYIKNYNIEPKKARKINRFIGFETVIMGVIMLITVPLPPTASVIGLILLIPYSLIGAVYGIITAKSKD